MSKFSKAAVAMSNEQVLRKSETVKNFMGGDSYTVDPITRLRMVTASSIMGEPSYYVGSRLYSDNKDSVRLNNHMSRNVAAMLKENNVIGLECDTDTVELMVKVINEALDYDFKATLEWAVTLREEYYIRLNPQVIMVHAAKHPKREEFTKKHPGTFGKINKRVMARADDAMSQLSYLLYTYKGKKSEVPSLLKRSWAKHFKELSRYEVAKYKKHDIGMINAVRICHASSPIINELMTTGTVVTEKQDKTWENLRSEGKQWDYIFNNINMGHMALLRNIRNFLENVSDRDLIKKYMEKLKSGVLKGKQFPFRYYTAYMVIEDIVGSLNNAQLALDTLEECIDISIENMPKLKGRTMCLSDNSGSAWGSFVSEFGEMVIAKIDNLSSVITAMRSDEGYVGKFGDRLRVFPISKRKGALQQAKEISRNRYTDVGGATEGGIWEFFNEAMLNKEHWDNIFIYSDQQAGTCKLYGTREQEAAYREHYSDGDIGYINVFKLIIDYRKQVSDRVNVFSVQTAGYDNMVIPNYAYRTNLMYGWTGKEIIFADAIIKEWDRLEKPIKH